MMDTVATIRVRLRRSREGACGQINEIDFDAELHERLPEQPALARVVEAEKPRRVVDAYDPAQLEADVIAREAAKPAAKPVAESVAQGVSATSKRPRPPGRRR